jgi:hypothetical protein
VFAVGRRAVRAPFAMITSSSTPGADRPWLGREGARRMSLVDRELAAVWRGYEHGVVTDDEVYHRLDELERLLWQQVFQRLHDVLPDSKVYASLRLDIEPVA